MSVELTARFFRSIDGDRQYTAADWADYFDTLFKHGVFAEQLDAFEVVGDGDELKVQVKPGRVFMNGYLGILDTEQTLDIDSQATGADRIDRIILKLDSSEDAGGRNIELYVKKGEAAEEPDPPSLERAGNIYEFSLAQVLIEGGEGFIPADRPVDERDDENLCGYVRYVAKPAWYPGGEVPLDAWMYVHFPDELTAEEKEDIEDDTELMAIIDEARLIKHIGSRGTAEHDVATTSEAGFMPPEDKEALQKMQSPDYQEFTSSGTWNKPEGAKWIFLQIYGAGGGGGAGGWANEEYIAGGGGGAGGAFFESLLPAEYFDDTVTVEVGAGGEPGEYESYGDVTQNPGEDGGDSKFGDIIAPGGTGGLEGRRHSSSSISMDGVDGAGIDPIYVIYASGDGGERGSSPGNDGGDAYRAAGGGGAGGGYRNDPDDGESNGDGGSSFGLSGGSSGTSYIDSDGTDGSDGQDASSDSLGAGSGGGGGGASGNESGGAGGDGGIPGGGAGGAGGSQSKPRDAGTGARGEVRVWAW